MTVGACVEQPCRYMLRAPAVHVALGFSAGGSLLGGLGGGGTGGGGNLTVQNGGGGAASLAHVNAPPVGAGLLSVWLIKFHRPLTINE
jgi:hypothetical protein